MKPRRFERHECLLSVRIRPREGSWEEAEVLNISPGGALVRCNKITVHLGEQVEIEVRSPEDLRVPATVTYAESIEFVIDEEAIEDSEVRWSDNAAGLFGVKFNLSNRKVAARVLALIEQLKKEKESPLD